MMKVRLLKKLRRIGRNKITIHSITETNGIINGIKYGYDEDKYSDLFHIGYDKEKMKRLASHIYMQEQIIKRRNKIA